MEPDPKSALTVAAPPGEELEAKPPSSTDGRIDGMLGTVVDGRYLLEMVIGEGGMGIVYRARHHIIDKRVAVKVLRDEMARDQEMTARFLQEARTASSIGNGHIVDVSDLGVMPDGSTYFVMEYLDGKSLAQQVETLGLLPLPRIVHIAKQIARGLGAAHAAGIVHRDLKPDNVMLVARGDDPDFVKILDFGIAKVGSQGTKLTRAGSIFGTPHYMSPEQAAGSPVDARTDIYALGIMMYEMAAGKVPFDAEGFMGILSQHLYKAPEPLSVAAKRSDMVPAFEAVVMKCLAKGVEGRYASMEALIHDLEAVERGLTPMAMLDAGAIEGRNTPPNLFEPPTATSGLALASGPPAKSSRRVWAAAAVVLVVTLASGLAVVMRQKPADEAIPVAAAEARTEVVSAESLPPLAILPKEKLLILSVDPLDARVFEDGKELGTPPLALRFKDGEKKTLTVSRAGYVTKIEPLDEADLKSDENKHIVKLTPSGQARAGAKAASKPSKPGTGKPVITDHDPDPWKRGL